MNIFNRQVLSAFALAAIFVSLDAGEIQKPEHVFYFDSYAADSLRFHFSRRDRKVVFLSGYLRDSGNGVVCYYRDPSIFADFGDGQRVQLGDPSAGSSTHADIVAFWGSRDRNIPIEFSRKMLTERVLSEFKKRSVSKEAQQFKVWFGVQVLGISRDGMSFSPVADAVSDPFLAVINNGLIKVTAYNANSLWEISDEKFVRIENEPSESK